MRFVLAVYYIQERMATSMAAFRWPHKTPEIHDACHADEYRNPVVSEWAPE
jgi:hypothetical protein